MEASESTSTTYDVSRRADLVKRFLAALIDGIIAGVLSVVPLIGTLVGAAYILVRDGLELSFMDRRSIGKKLMKLRAVNLDGTPMDLNLSIRRNWPLVLGTLGTYLSISLGAVLGLIGLVEAILVLTDAKGRRIGDKVGNTMVVEVAD